MQPSMISHLLSRLSDSVVMRPRNPLLLLLLALALALALAFLPLALSCKSQNWASANGEAMPCYLKPKNRGPPGYLDDQVPI